MGKQYSVSPDLNGNKIQNVGAGSVSGDAATWEQLGAIAISRTAFNALVTNSTLIPQRIYNITGEPRFAIATGTNTFDMYAKEAGIPPEYIGNTYALVCSGSGTTLTQIGITLTTTSSGALSNPQQTAATTAGRTRRTVFNTAATAGSLAGLRSANRHLWRGNAAGRGGFWYQHVGGVENSIAGMRFFMGLTDLNAAISNLDPTTDTTLSKIGVGLISNTGNLQFIQGPSGAAPTVTDLGTDFGFSSSDMYDLLIYCLPNPSSINYSVRNMTTNVTVTGTITNPPLGPTFMGPTAWLSNNTTANAIAMNLSKIEYSSQN